MRSLWIGKREHRKEMKEKLNYQHSLASSVRGFITPRVVFEWIRAAMMWGGHGKRKGRVRVEVRTQRPAALGKMWPHSRTHYCLHLYTPPPVTPLALLPGTVSWVWSIPGVQVSNAVGETVSSRILLDMEGLERQLDTGLSHMEAHSAPQTWVTCGG
uniref:Uncharacterized protein n=1 Tax=Rousettus aegyptiacus TaxID=9407 RepID=A0A7J8H1P4_ROUAE|nr:hypothetical protein HJG63_011249 [Rousettus aegyptiacus]